MARVKGGIASQKRRKHLLAQTKGFRWGRKSKVRLAKQAIFKAGRYAFRDRRVKKREFRKLWQIKIGISSRELGLNYSRFINGLKTGKIELDRKILASQAEKHPEIFKEVFAKINKK